MTKKFLIIILATVFLNPVLVSAQATTATGLPDYSGVDSSITAYLCTPSEPADGKDLERCINRMYRFGITIGAIALVLFLVIAGYFYITGGETGKGRAKGILINAFVGMAILLGSYVLLYFINPSLVAFRPIQPPIFSVADLPSCAAVGLGESCVTADGGVSFGGAGCAMPMADSAVVGFNNSVHYPWDNNPETPDRHRTVRIPPNGPPKEGAVDLKVSKSSPVYSPISGKIDYRSKSTALGGTGSYITISTDLKGSGCAAASGCANLAHIDPSVSAGQTVTAGQQVGVTTVYSGGFGPHLHLELKLGGQWITGDGKKGTWDNMKSAISKCGSGSGGPVAGEPAGLISAKTLVPELVVDMQYASASPSSNNFMKTALYTGQYAKYGSGCYLTQATVEKLKKAQAELTKLKPGYKLKAWDCYRPKGIQQQMRDWGDKQSPPLGTDKIAPAGSGNHPKGLAIDLTIVDAQGKDLAMPTKFDDFKNSAQSNSNSALLQKVMGAGSFSRAKTEWWHFN